MIEVAQNDNATFFSNEDIDQLSASGNYMTRIFDDIVRDHQPKIIVDVGCGDGFFGSYFFEKHGCQVDGVDGSSYGLKLAKQRGYQNVTQIEDFNAGSLNLQKTYDLALCKDVLEHLYRPAALLRSIHEVVKPKGLVLVLVPNHFLLIHRLKFLITNDLDTQKYFPHADSFDFPHIRFFKDRDMRMHLDRERFRILKTYHDEFAYFPGLRRLPFGKSLKRSLAARFPDQFSTALVYLCEKI